MACHGYYVHNLKHPYSDEIEGLQISYHHLIVLRELLIALLDMIFANLQFPPLKVLKKGIAVSNNN